jgi:hypothetical protein
MPAKPFFEGAPERGRLGANVADATPAEAARGMAMLTKLVG